MNQSTIFAQDLNFAGVTLEQPREINSNYQSDRQEYDLAIQRILQRLAARADPALRDQIGQLDIRIVNRGRIAGFISGDRVIFDIAYLDLLTHFSLEYAISRQRADPFYLLEFHILHAIALSGNKRLEQIDPRNNAALTQKQFRTLWDDVLRYKQTFFENALAFVVAHEIGHVALEHNAALNREFPSEEVRSERIDSFNRIRRNQELEADRFGTDLALRAFYSPAIILPWFLLIDMRQRHYGKSSEYPVPVRRESVVLEVYGDWVSGGQMPDFEYVDLDRLSVRNMMWLSNRQVNLENVRKVREFRLSIQLMFDEVIFESLHDQTITAEDLTAAVQLIELIRVSVSEGCAEPAYLEQLRGLIDDAEQEASRFDRKIAQGLALSACGDDSYQALYLNTLINTDPPKLGALRNVVDLMRTPNDAFGAGIEWQFLLNNAYFRWNPKIFAALTSTVADVTGEVYEMKPYVAGEPLEVLAPAHSKIMEFLSGWDGNYDLQPDGKAAISPL